jgi:hypothetical protein
MIVKQQTFVATHRDGMDIMLHPNIYLEDFSCVNVGQCNDGRVGVSLSEEARINKQWGQQCQGGMSYQVL